MSIRIRLIIVSLLPAALAGCASPGELELLTAGRKGIELGRSYQQAQHRQILLQLESQMAALDRAFDSDVEQAASGRLIGGNGDQVALTAEWVISARKGYVAARDIVHQQLRQSEAGHATAMDNLAAADEALEMATQLVLMRQATGAKLRQYLTGAQRRLIHE